MRNGKLGGIDVNVSLKKLGILSMSMLSLSAPLAVYGASKADQGPVNLNFTYRITSPQDEKWIKWLVNTFNNENKGSIKVLATGIPDAVYKSKINLQLRGSGAPDVFFTWEGGYAKSMIDAGYAAPLDNYYRKYGWNTDLTPAALQIATQEGHKYFVPYSMNASVVWYRTDIFKKYNLKVPTTWNEFVSDSEILKKHHIAPLIEGNQQKWEAQFLWTAYFVNKYGVKAYDDLLNRRIPWTDPRVVATFSWEKSLETNGYFAPGLNSMDFDTTAIIPWSQGKAAMWYEGSFILSKFLNDSHTKLLYPVSFFPFPKIGNVPPTMEVFAENCFMINAHSTHKDAAAKFLNFVVSAEAQKQMVDMSNPFPVNVHVDLSNQPAIVQRLGKVIARYKGSTFMHVDHALAPNVALPFLNSLSSVLTGQMTPQQAAQTTEDAAKMAMGPVKE